MKVYQHMYELIRLNDIMQINRCFLWELQYGHSTKHGLIKICTHDCLYTRLAYALI